MATWRDPTVSWSSTTTSWRGLPIGGGPSDPDPSPHRLVIRQPSARLQVTTPRTGIVR